MTDRAQRSILHQLLGSSHCSDSRDVMNGHRARVFAIQYHPHYQNVFVSGGWDDTVQVHMNESHEHHWVKCRIEKIQVDPLSNLAVLG